MKYILAIDEGTSSTRARLYTLKGRLVKSSQYLLTQYYPKQGWVEHDPEEIWQKTIAAIHDVTESIHTKDILTCGITNQRETTLIWDKQTGKCLSNALVWQDRRTEEFCRSLSALSETIVRKTGLMPNSYFSGSKLRWLLNEIPEANTLAQQGRLAFGTIDSFLIWRLTNGKSHVTDVTNASRTLLYNIFEHNWDEDLLRLFEIPYSLLPEVLDCDGDFGCIASDILPNNIPITGVAGDQQAALVGQRCFKEGMIKATYGTGGFLLLNTGVNPVLSKHQLLTTVAYRMNNKMAYGLEGSFYQAGTTVKWLRDQLKLISHAAETESLARSLSSNEGVYLIPSFTGLGAPHWLSVNGAMITGLSLSSNAAHFARAALECVCYQTHDILRSMRDDSGLDLSLLRVDGGMSENSWFLQFLASQVNALVQRPHDVETTALGAALLAAIGANLVDPLEGFEENHSFEREFSPSDDCDSAQKDYEGWLNTLSLLKDRNSNQQ
ncbi:glycerol kinase GlpK [Legionella impletisoli]|uniref:Glycerol kinase n=1 Tax=Legionella impletisoli TaxID=343510 RepID=A0A917JP59_9GAMM|nr:glycerol kinase GlpK [Legionella impletisoli]GGI77893.1 glycerol kinase [Legionella impletisoli]